jgi:HD-GYP domain-containing protein (c-di-GMP phosphodiesterase class II)
MKTLTEAGISIVPTPLGLRYVRAQLGLAQDELAAAIGVSFATVNRWERNRYEPTADNRAALERFCRKKGVDYESYQIGMVMLKVISNADAYTGGHCHRVCVLAGLLGRRMQGVDVEALKTAAILHDLGKVFVDHGLVKKRGRYTSGEREKMKEHAGAGGILVAMLMVSHPLASTIVRQHHERLDGGGYYRTPGHKIIVESRILAVCDVFDALTTTRSYRPAMAMEIAMDKMKKDNGLDQQVVKLLERVLRDPKVLGDLESDDHLYVFQDRRAFYGKARRGRQR